MASVGDFLLYSALTITLIALVGYHLSDRFFTEDADDRGYNTAKIDMDGCFIDFNNETGVTNKFCKKEYGFIGINEWILDEDKQFVKDTITSLVDGDIIKTDCIYGVEKMTVISNENQTMTEYTCYLPR